MLWFVVQLGILLILAFLLGLLLGWWIWRNTWKKATVTETFISSQYELNQARDAVKRLEKELASLTSELAETKADLEASTAAASRAGGSITTIGVPALFGRPPSAGMATEIEPIYAETGSGIDDLQRIDGIGPMVGAALTKAGIRSFAQLERARPEALRAALDAEDVAFAPSLPSWPDQAGYLARGDDAGFEMFVAYLRAGRDIAEHPDAVLGDSEEFTGPATDYQPPSSGDDLRRIEGIGPKIDEALRKAGITTFAKLESAGHDELKSAIEKGGVRFAPSLVTWGTQASYLLRGDEVGLVEYQDFLITGRDPSDGAN